MAGNIPPGGAELNVSEYKIVNSSFLYIPVLLSDFDDSRPPPL